jgi:Ca-activated chloride channel family protein
MKPHFSLICFVLLVLCNAVAGQTPVDADDIIRVDTDVTNLPFTATDKERHFITTLRAEDVRVFEDGVPQTIFTFQRETNRPLAIAFLIDVSISQEYTLAKEKAAAREFIESVIQSGKDQVAIVPFTGFGFLEQPMTRDVLSVYQALERVELAAPVYLGSGRPLTGIATGPGMRATPDEGTTALWDAISLTAEQVLIPSAGQRRRVIILLSDGWDTSSRLSKKDAVDRTLGAETVIYSIGIGDSKRDGVNRDALRDVAERTGGRAFFPKRDVDLKVAFADIEQELRTQYLIAYSSTNKKRDGAYRKISIEITNPDLRKITLRHRPGYFATVQNRER